MANNEKMIWDLLMKQIGNPYGVAGLMGNLYAESGLNPKNIQNSFNKKLKLTDEEYTSKVDDGSYKNFVKDGAGYGLAQWTYHTRKQALLKYAQSTHTSIGDILTQIEFLWKELQKYSSVLKVLKNATTIREASDAVLTKYEKPANQSDAVKKKRAQYGVAIFERQNKVIKKYVRVNRNSVYVRTGPGTMHDKLGVAFKGKTFELIRIDKNTGWYCIQYSENYTGWITNKYTSIFEG